MQSYYEVPMFTQYPDVLSVKRLQEVLGIGRSKAYELVQSEAIPSFKIGTSTKIPKGGVLCYLYGQMEDWYNAIHSDQTNLSCQKGVGDC